MILKNHLFVWLSVLTINLSYNSQHAYAQSIPASEENLPYLVTFGKEANTGWGDDDFCQIFFFIIPKDQKKPFFLKVYDPNIGGKEDEIKGEPNSKTRFSVYGGKDAFTHKDAIAEQPAGNFRSGILLATKTFDQLPQYDQKWYSFGPFNPVEGEYISEFNGYIIKVIAEGISGDDGNLYRYFLSTESEDNVPVEGANAFTYEYTFRLFDKPGAVSHIYPFVSKDVVSIKVHTFDYDADGIVRIVSVAKKHEQVNVSNDNVWVESKHLISEQEKNTSLDVQMIKLKNITNNNVVFYITNQYGSLLPFYTTPIGGIPKYKYEIGVRPQR